MLDDFKTAMSGVRKHLMKRTAKSNFLIVGEKVGSSFKPKMDHLVCFLPGTLALAVHSGQLSKGWTVFYNLNFSNLFQKTDG